MSRTAIAVACVACGLLALDSRPTAQSAGRNPGVSTRCGSFTIDLDLFLGSVTLYELDDEGWAYVDLARKRRAVTGTAEGVTVAAIDSPSNHDSHDLDFHLVVDPGQDDLLSVQPGDYIGVEWETGIRPWETRGDGAHPTFPKWVWPADGDRVWAEGNWVFDCGHPVGGLYKTEIHPPRAFASMRAQAMPLPGTGLTPVPVTRTDLYISGRAGFAPQQLNCGTHIILDSHPDNCGQPAPPADQSYKTTPIDDTDFTFDVCLPPRPAGAAFSHEILDGPRNSVAIAPAITLVAAAGACATSSEFDPSVMMRVAVPLAGSGTPPEAVYARHITAGWIAPPAEPLARRRVAMRWTNLTEDHDLDPGAGELSFWWVNVDRAAPGWLRLSDFATGNMNDYDDETGFGDGEMSYAGAAVDFYLRGGQGFSVRSRGYEQDCYDAFGGFNHRFDLLLYSICALDLQNHASADELAKGTAAYAAEDAGNRVIHTSDYDLHLSIEHLPLGLEDTTALSTRIACVPSGEVALVGEPLTCTVRTDNAGPGLPRALEVHTSFSAATAQSGTWSVAGPFASGPHGCDAFGPDLFCHGVVPPVAAATPAIALATAVPQAPGLLTARVDLATASNDATPGDHTATATIDVHQPVDLDVLPGDAANALTLGRRQITVAILSAAALDASAVLPATVCFGDAGAPGERACTETHGRGHLEDVNGDQRADLVLHFLTSATGIDAGDTRVCLSGRTSAGIGVYGCQAVSVR